MNLKAIATKAVATAFSVVDSILKNATYTQAGAVAYNTATGAVTPNSSGVSVRALFCHFKADETKPASFREGMTRCLIQRGELGAIAPATSDYITDIGGSVWFVVAVEDNPTESHWSFIVKRDQK